VLSRNSFAQLQRTVVSRELLENTTVFKGLKVLLDAGADINAQDQVDGSTVLQIFCTTESSQMAEWLIENYKPKLDLRDNFNDTVLHSAVLFQTNATETLLNAGLDINAIGNRGQTPLHVILLGKLIHERNSLYNCLATESNFWNVPDGTNFITTQYFSPLQVDDSEIFGCFYPRWFENRDPVGFGVTGLHTAVPIPIDYNVEALLKRKPNVTIGKNEYLQIVSNILQLTLLD
jgi:ankyrin repeat protein